MGTTQSGIHRGRLAPTEYETNFSDLHPRLDDHEALVAADPDRVAHWSARLAGVRAVRQDPSS